LLSTLTTEVENLPNSARKGLRKTLRVATESMGTVAPKRPVAGSVASTELRRRAARCSGPPEIWRRPSGLR
jgi:hypothetical protein